MSIQERIAYVKQGIVVVSPRLCDLLSIVISVGAITLWPVILSRTEPDPITVNHERIHIRQQAELLVVVFYALYGLDYLKGRLRGLSADEAYMNIRFEREAYAFEKDMDYLSRRPRFAWRSLP